MILGNLHTIEKELRLYPAAIQQGIRFLLEQPLAELPVGKQVIDGEKIYAKTAAYETEPQEKRRPERHEKYIDIQCIVSGSEKIGLGIMENAGPVDTDKLASADILYYGSHDGMTDESFITLEAGQLAVFFPWDVHRPNCNAADAAAAVKKVVVKVAMDALK